MIELVTGNIFDSPAMALVNPVNCVGVMGAGLALKFKIMYPRMMPDYIQACKIGHLVPGVMHTHFLLQDEPGPTEVIICFPTKNHWKDLSKIEYIQQGLSDLIETIKGNGIASIAIPPLGCGLGGLKWADVKPLILEAFEQLPEVHVYLYGA